MFNRYFLLGTLLLGLLIPALDLELSHNVPVISNAQLTELLPDQLEEINHLNGTLVESLGSDSEKAMKWPMYLYLLIAALLLFRFVHNLHEIKKLTKKSGSEVEGMRLVLLNENTTPFSFFHFLFIGKKPFEEGIVDRSMIRHELIHSQQLHSIDILMVELLSVFFWFNPFVWQFKKAISENHEYLADAGVVKAGVDLECYSKQLIESIYPAAARSLVSGFSYVQTKNRILMLRKEKNNAYRNAFKLGLVLLLFGTALSFTSFTLKRKAPLVVVIDAGHGGKDNGMEFEGLSEKELALSISQKLKEVNKNRGIKLIMTRNSDEFLALKERVDPANQQQVDLMLSIHFNFAKSNKSNGVEAYYYKDNKYVQQSLDYSRIMVSEQIKTVSEHGKIKTAEFYVLKNSNCPSVTLELGFLSNPSDREKLMDEAHQTEIALAIYRGLEAIQDKKSR